MPVLRILQKLPYPEIFRIFFSTVLHVPLKAVTNEVWHLGYNSAEAGKRGFELAPTSQENVYLSCCDMSASALKVT